MSPPELAAFTQRVVDLLAAEHVNVVVHPTLASTNALGARYARDVLREAGTVRRTLFVAHAQAAGRGRRGNTWVSTAGRGVYASLVEPLASPERAASLPMAVGAGLCGALNDLLAKPACRLKWPNDLMVGGRKVGGLLIELVQQEEDSAAVIGFGINTHFAADELPTPQATALALEGAEIPDLAACIAHLTRGTLTALSWAEGEVITRYRAVSSHEEGEEITFRLAGEILRGRFRGIDERGFLLLETAEGVRAFSAGEVLTE